MRPMFRVLGSLRRSLVDAALSVTTRQQKEYLLRRVAEKVDVASFGCAGDLGFFQGSSRDQVVFAHYVATRTWAPELQALLNRLLERGGTLIDVGANIGLTSIPVSRVSGVRCYAFEPDPENYRFLVSNIAANRAENVRAFNVAMMSEEGTLAFERSADNMGDHRVHVDVNGGAFGEDRRDVVQVQGKRLDSALASESLKATVVLKVDTQGAEVRVLTGAAGLLPRVDVAILEFWPYGLRRVGDTPQGFYDAISTFPFGAILGGGPLAWMPTGELIAELRRRLPADASHADHADVVLSRRAGIA